MLRSAAGSIFFASQCAAALSGTADMLVRKCTKMGTELLYMEIVMECGSFAGGTKRKERKLSELRGRCHVNGIWLRFSVGTGGPGLSNLRQDRSHIGFDRRQHGRQRMAFTVRSG